MKKDASQWATHFSYDSRNNHCCNHEHDYKETCVKYVKKKLEAEISLRSNKCPSCRFWFFRVKKLQTKQGVKQVRRRGKPLVQQPYIEETDDRNDEFRCKVKRGTPFRSTSNDVGQVSDRCNLDFQFLPCAPPPLAAEDKNSGSSQTAVEGTAEDPGSEASRIAAAAMGMQGDRRSKRKRDEIHKWLYGTRHNDLPSHLRSDVVESFSAAFRKQYVMDFYITKYQGKQMEALTPLFQSMQGGVHRLEDQEREEEEQAKATADENDEPTAKKRKTHEDLAKRARRLTIRLASMANRCYWLSATEVAVHILTGGDCLQSHNNQRLFTRQLQWAFQECKRHLNGEDATEAASICEQSIDAVTVQLRCDSPQVTAAFGADALQLTAADRASEPAVDTAGRDEADAGNDGEDSEADDAHAEDADQPDAEEGCEAAATGGHSGAENVVAMSTTTASTNAADDYTHRGKDLLAMPLYFYRMHVVRNLRGHSTAVPGGTIFEFEPQYPLARTYVQKVMLDQMDVPTIDGFQCPTWIQDPEQNCLLKSMLFTPWACHDALTCGCVSRFAHLLSSCCGAAVPGAAQPGVGCSRKFTFERAWRTRRSEIHVWAQRADDRSDAARKHLVLADTTLFAKIKEPKEELDRGLEFGRTVLACSTTCRKMPAHALWLPLAFSGLICSWHEEQCTLAEYCAYKARDVLAHMDLAAEARVKPPVKKNVALDVDEDGDSDGEDDRRQAKALEFEDVGGGVMDDTVDDIQDVPVTEVSAHPVHDHQAAIAIAFQHERLQELESKARLSHEDEQMQDVESIYGAMIREHRGLSESGARHSTGLTYNDDFHDMIALQKQNIALAKGRLDDCDEPAGAEASSGAPQPASDDQLPILVPLPLAMQGPGKAAWKLVTDAECTGEQTDAVALLALSMEKRFVSRTDKTTHRLPVATAQNNHRVVWLGGGGVGKTRTLCKVVEPLALTYYGPHGYLAEAQSNYAA